MQGGCVVKNNHCRVMKWQMKSRKESGISGVLGRKRVQIGELSKNIRKLGDLSDFDRKRFYSFGGFIVFFCVLGGC